MRERALPRHAWPLDGRHGWSATAVVQFLFDRYLLLPIGAAIAVIWANTASESYFTIAHRLSFPVNEVGMAFFVGLLAQEVVEAVMPGGALHSWRRWNTALVAAAGGMFGAAGVYIAYVQLSYETLLFAAWPVAIAVDAAATYYLLKTLFPRSGLLPFALLLTIATNIVGLLVIAIRGMTIRGSIEGALLLAVAAIVLAALRMGGVRSFWVYFLIPGTMCWFAFYLEGIHTAFALVPIVAALPHEPRPQNLFVDRPDDDEVHHYEHQWNLLVQGVLFLFGLVNAGVLLRQFDTGTWAVLSAALIGRPLGILLGCGLAVAAGLHLPKRVGWRELVVLALATSSGFTFALFFATDVFAIGPALSQIKIGALSTVVGGALAVGAAWLLGVWPPRREARQG